MILNALRGSLRTTAPSLLRRNITTSTLKSPLLAAKPTPLLRSATPIFFNPTQFAIRGAASHVSGRPGSQTIEHAAENIREEVGNSAADLARTIAGGNYFDDSVKPPSKDTFLGITNAVAHAVPQPYVVVGLAGSLPYLGSTLTTIYLARQAGEAATAAITSIDPGVAITVLHQALSIQTTYGAVLLSFLGALHWGFEFAGYGGQKGYSRLFLGAAPVAYGWSTLALDPMSALIAQWVGFTGLWYADLKATGAGWTPKWYSQYRFYLSILVGTCIIGTLAATSYWGPVGGHGFVSHDLKMIRDERKSMHPDNRGLIPGNIEAVPAPAEADNYVIVKKKDAGKGEGENKQQ
ncbi:uncharacterized protein PHACADRAFT_143265 [Phanerochaete carnosa HHB-10118-sp]|uniref:Uncharacterized protein n=1 Tax=Phanerochaete carnosa (strain HHB-10118-sp) TaxID=650164 RepID=K5UYI2_PHACS|nr:uncharacterized protein PHACADRAFT_143265 [Phanerochaete carnosa HHB-10118-sp]EKM55206.1 hypothetical protein PHACADRAFT_143265 [Phanerochaete carnosa HHB-10118-sp]